MSTTLERLSARVRSLAQRVRARRSDGDGDGGTAEHPEAERWTCECGQAFRITGRDRHRVVWAEGADAGEPVLSGRCPSCNRPLPGANAA